jgi:sphingomyelin phosphodiesterase
VLPVSNYKCDLPEIMLDNLLGHLASNYSADLDFIFWTGYALLRRSLMTLERGDSSGKRGHGDRDNPPHDIWMESRESQLASTQYLVDKLKAAFPKTPVFPTLGTTLCLISTKPHSIRANASLICRQPRELPCRSGNH